MTTAISQIAKPITRLAIRDDAVMATLRSRFLRRRARSGIDRGSEQIADAGDAGVELRIGGHREGPRPREGDGELLDETAGPCRHHQYAVRQEYRFHNA